MPNYGKFGEEFLEAAASDLATIPFFPQDSRASVMFQLARMCPHKEALRFVIDTACAKCKTWPGMSELRGLLCTRYDAADGIDEPNCSIPGFSPYECEQRYLDRHESDKSLTLSAEEMAILKQLNGSQKLLGNGNESAQRFGSRRLMPKRSGTELSE